jgi:hypothetical protein
VNAGVAGGVLVETPIANGVSWVYTDDNSVVSADPLYAKTDNNVFTATFIDIAGVAVLNVNDLCANIGVLAPADPCSLGFTFTDASLGTPFLESDSSLLGILGLDLNADAIGLRSDWLQRPSAECHTRALRSHTARNRLTGISWRSET